MTLKRRESSTAGRKGTAALHSRHEFYSDTWCQRLAFKHLLLKLGPHKPIRITLGAAAALVFLLFGAVGSAWFFGPGGSSEESQVEPEADRKVLSDFMEPWASGLGRIAATISHPCAQQEERAQICERTMSTIAQEMEDILSAVDRPPQSEDLVNHSNDASRL
ncbi:MTERFD1 [Symbiodinium sp. CCMP2592]|nr:MTERFD1 [Symbiodinium sp. CCMP2592]